MPDLLLELFSEEIPARMQARAAEDLRKLVTDRLVDAGLVYEGAKAFVTPRRLALAVQGVPVRQPDVKEEKKGPRVGAPAGAIEGFVRAAGLKSIDEATVKPDKKGDFYVAVIEKPGRPAIEVIGRIVPEVVRTFPWPKSMRWGARSAEPGALGWVRPLHSIVATFGPETEEPDIVAFAVDGIAAGDETRGHRFMAPQPFKVRRLEDYAAKLEKAKVVLDPERRRQIILADAKNLAFAQGYELVEDEGLLAEVAGLVEWPVVLMGSFDEAFLAIPNEVIRATIRNNQKCFVLRDPKTAKLAPKFILVANIEAEDGGKEIVAGNERVIRARLSDAKFFYETDLKTRLEDRLPKFNGHRLSREARHPGRAHRAHREPCGRAGAHRRRRRGEDKARGAAGEGRPAHRSGRRIPGAAGADGEVLRAGAGRGCVGRGGERGPLQAARPQGSRAHRSGPDRRRARRQDRHVGWILGDRREADGIEGPVCAEKGGVGCDPHRPVWQADLVPRSLLEMHIKRIRPSLSDAEILRIGDSFEEFFYERLKVQLRDEGARHDLVDAVLHLRGSEAGIVSIVRRVEALGKFLDTEDGKNLLAGYKRATNIIRIEEKKDGREYVERPDPSLYRQDEERALSQAINIARDEASAAVAREDFEAAMRAMAKLRPHVDAFFDKVTVNVGDGADKEKLRENRLKLLNEIRDATRTVADFSRIEG